MFAKKLQKYKKMRKPITVLILLIISFNFVSGQERGRIRISLVLEPVISWMKSDHRDVGFKGFLPGYNFGMKIDHFIGENYAFATGLTINTVGGKIAYCPPDYNLPCEIQHYRLKYIEIPLGLRLRSDDFRRINIYGRFGLSPQIKIKSSDNYDNNIDSEVKLYELGYHLGGGIEYSLGGRSGLILGLIFNNGFTDITKKEGFPDKTILNRFSVEIGFIF